MREKIEKELKEQKEALQKQLKIVEWYVNDIKKRLDKEPFVAQIDAGFMKDEAQAIAARMWVIDVLEKLLEEHEGKD